LMAHFIPCRNAPFALLNRWTGNRLARRLLFSVYPQRENRAGFAAYYDRCTPSRMGKVCEDCGLEVVEVIPYFVSDYFQFFAPAHLFEICRQSALRLMRVRDFTETFTLVARKP
jgi:hypothetical protein